MLYQKKKFFLTNTMSGKREEFKPAHPPKVLFYSCGPTVYGPTHIGNARAYLFSEFLARWLKHIGYDVNFVTNYTDVDDKIIARSKEEKVSALDVANKYAEYCDQDMRLLDMQLPNKRARVTESMPEIIEVIEKILANQNGYVVDGEVFFSIESFPEYGKLSGKKVEDLVAGASERVEVDRKKKNPLDFSLWKPHKPGEPFWESPWGKGRPGWHIECSGMIARWLGETIDLHHGGPDLIFPHHENEIAQSEAAHAKPLCSHWVHHAFLTSGHEKMSKSLGNILSTREFIETYGAELLKFIYVSFHFRSTVPYTQEMLTQALSELERIYYAKKWAQDTVGAPLNPMAKGAPWAAMLGKAHQAFEKIEDELFADLNSPGALGHLFTHIRELNRVEAEASGKSGVAALNSAERQQVASEFLILLEKNLNSIFNVFAQDSNAMLTQIETIRRARHHSGDGLKGPNDAQIQALIEQRNAARKNKDYKLSDEIRLQLDAQGIILVDSPSGTTWKSK